MFKKTILISASALMLLGALLFGGMMTMLKWNFGKLSTVKYETNEHIVNEAFYGISVSTDTARVIFVPSEDGSVSVVCNERAKSRHSVSVEDGVLRVEIVDTRKWYDRIDLDFGTHAITVSLPADAYGDLTVKNKTGSITVPNDFSFASATLTVDTGEIDFSASVTGELKIKTSTGGVRAGALSAGALDISVSTGRITLEDVIAEGEMTLRSSTGGIRLTRCDAAEIDIKTDTGSVVGTLLSEKLFDTRSSTGRVRVPEPSGNERCKIRTDTGSIRIEIAEKTE